LQRRGRLASQWLKERRGVRGEDSRGRRQEEECSEEVDEGVRVDATTDEEESSQTSEGVVEESKPVTPEDIGLHQEVNATLQENETPQIKEIVPGGKGTIPESPIPPTSSTNLVISTVNPSTIFLFLVL
jgi:hypothetical protein